MNTPEHGPNLNTMNISNENDFSVSVWKLLLEIHRRGKYQDWRDGKYHPHDDPTFPPQLLVLNNTDRLT